jgi:hypothetical protein
MKKLAVFVAVFSLFLAANLSVAAYGAKTSPHRPAAVLATTETGNPEKGTFWFSCDLVPYGFPFHAGGYVWYTAYAGEPGWDRVTQDWDFSFVTNGVANPYCQAYALTYLSYYQEGYNYVDSWAGQYYVAVVHTANDSVVSVGDHPNKNYYVTMHVAAYPGAQGGADACCGVDWAGFWAK